MYVSRGTSEYSYINSLTTAWLGILIYITHAITFLHLLEKEWNEVLNFDTEGKRTEMLKMVQQALVVC